MDIPSSIDYLVKAQHASGGWGYKTGHRPVVEATAVVLLSLREEPSSQGAFQHGMKWLLGCQHEDGGWGINESDFESCWHTAWALIVLKAASQDTGMISRGETWLSEVATYEVSSEAIHSHIPVSFSIGAFAWPWLPGQIPWVEPTALALLALKGMTNSSLVEIRQKSALDYLRRYRTPTGGWWTGNAGPLDTIVIPRVYQTSLALIALASVSKSDIQSADLTVLQQDLETEPGMLAHAIGLLAMRLLEASGDNSATILTSQQLPDGSWENNPFVTGWAILASKGAL